jgi:hypothetical protein
MGARDEASLSPQERAVLAGLEARAEADDPRLAEQLRGRRRWWPGHFGARVKARLQSVAVGCLILALGVAMMLLSISTTLILGVVGAVLAAGGLVLTAEVLLARRTSKPSDPKG